MSSEQTHICLENSGAQPKENVSSIAKGNEVNEGDISVRPKSNSDITQDQQKCSFYRRHQSDLRKTFKSNTYFAFSHFNLFLKHLQRLKKCPVNAQIETIEFEILWRPKQNLL